MSKFFLLLCASLSFCLTGCTLGKIIVHFKPDVDDHQKIFACDTIPAFTVSDDFEFVEAQDSFNLPPLEQWLNTRQRHKTNNPIDFLEKTKTTALIIIRNDSILYEKYLNEGAKERTQIVFSVTKAMTATLVAIAVEEGLLHLEQSIADFIPAYQGDARRHIKIKHLLGMVSGLDWNDYKDLAKLGQLYYTANHQQLLLNKTRIKAAPEQEFVYKSISTQILSQCLVQATQQTYAAYMQSKIWDYIGHKQAVYITLDSKETRTARSFGGMAISARDMARFGRLLLNDGLWGGKRLVPAWFLKQLRDRDLEHWIGYRNCFWRNGYEAAGFEQNEQFWAAGFSGQYIYVSPLDNIIIIRTGLKEKDRWSVLLGRLVAVLTGKGNDLSRPELNFANQFDGNYRNNKGQQMQLEKDTKLDKHGRQKWNWTRDYKQFVDNKEINYLYPFDGVSLGFKKQGEQTRLYFKVESGIVQGFYYNCWPSTQFDYFKKVN